MNKNDLMMKILATFGANLRDFSNAIILVRNDYSLELCFDSYTLGRQHRDLVTGRNVLKFLDELMMEAAVQLNDKMKREHGAWLRNIYSPERFAHYLDAKFPPLKPEAEKQRDELTEDSIKRGSSKWNGEGLPPAGVECEYKYKDHAKEFKRGVIKFAGDKLLVMDSGYEQCYHIDSLDFRPIKTEAEKERERLIDLGSRTIEMKCGSAGSAYKKYVSVLIDAGWKCDTSQNGESDV